MIPHFLQTDDWGRIMQLISIAFKGVLICMIVRQLSDMKYSLYDIIVTRIRYLIQTIKYSFTNSRYIPDLDLNEGWNYLRENRQYKWIAICLLTQIVAIFALMQDLHTGNYQTKSQLWWISSPGQSFSLTMGIFYLFDRNRRLSNENKLLRSMLGTIN